MKTTSYKLWILLFLAAPMLVLAKDGTFKGRFTKEKTIKKEYEVNADALLKVSNSYGNLTLSSWNENRIMIEVTIKTNGNNEEKVQKKLDEITVDFEASSAMVSAKTVFNKDNSWGWNWGKGNNVNMQIDYVIKLPVKNSVHLSNDYGNITLDRIDGYAKISCDYGRLELGELHGRNNDLSFDYTSKSRIGYINSGKITADYSGYTIEKAGDLIINSDYTNGTIEELKNLQYSNDYGNLEVGEAANVEGNGDYINVTLGIVHGTVEIVADYGAVKIGSMAPDAGNVNLRTNYTGIKIGYASTYYFDFEITTDYAAVSGKDDFEIEISKEKSSDRYYKGYYGQSNSGNLISINSDYGNIAFSKN
jgi:hypothetical protein